MRVVIADDSLLLREGVSRLLVAAGWVSEGMAALSRAFARWGIR